MKVKKFLSLALSLALIFAFSFNFNSALWAEELEPEEAQPSVEFLDWLEEQEAINEGLIDSEDIEPRGYIPDPVDLSHLADNPPVFDFDSGTMRLKASALPSSYKSTYLTSVKNQGGYGTCWSFAALGAIEANALKNSLGTLDLSEFHMAYFVYGDTRAGKSFTRSTVKSGDDAYLDQGGNSTQSIALLSRLGGPTAETILPYPLLDSYLSNKSSYTKPTGYPEDAQYTKTLFLKETYNLGIVSVDNRDTIKQMIQTYGAVQASYYSGGQTTALNASEPASDDLLDDNLDLDTGYNNGSGGMAYYYPDSGTSTNHAVLLVGWNDNYDKNNFNPKPNNNGAWLVKNSWGTSWGDAGYFWMSYEQFITSAVVYQAEAITANLKHYGYDDLGKTGAFGYGAGVPGWGANVFRAESSETLKKVAFYTTGNNASYTVYVYKNLTSNASPVAGGTEAYTASGTFPCTGYHTLDVGSIPLAAGEYFSVLVKFTTPSYAYSIPAERSLGNFAKPVVNQRESYYASGSSVPTSWTDAYSDSMNFCIKAFTVPSDGSSPSDNTDTAPVITTSSLAAGTVGTSYSASLAATGTAPITWSISSGSLPTGLSLNASTGAISGTPTQTGTFSFTVTASNSAGTNSKSLAITINAAAAVKTVPIITTSSLAAGMYRAAYSVNLTATGTTPITWSLASGTLPTGLSLNRSTGVISGTPTKTGSFSFRIKAANSAGNNTRSFTIKINNNPAYVAPTITTSSLPTGMYRAAYSTSLAATGTAPINWSLSSGSLPTGLSFNRSTGIISGTPTKTGSFSFKIKAANSMGSVIKAFTIRINNNPAYTAPTITTSSLPTGMYRAAYSTSLAATGTAPISWSLYSGSLPTGLSFNRSTGVISGTPTKTGSFSFRIRASNSMGSVIKSFAIRINNNPAYVAPTIPTSSLPAGMYRAAYSASVAVKGTDPITLSLYSGSLPTGLSFNRSTGVISGTPTKTGSFSFRIKAANSIGSVIKSFTIRINNNPAYVAPTIRTSSLPAGRLRTSYSASIAATGTSPITFSRTSGSLPNGLTLNSSTGVISGTPTRAGTFKFTVRASNSMGSVTKTFSIRIN